MKKKWTTNKSTPTFTEEDKKKEEKEKEEEVFSPPSFLPSFLVGRFVCDARDG